jgi:hypothetical protein
MFSVALFLKLLIAIIESRIQLLPIIPDCGILVKAVSNEIETYCRLAKERKWKIITELQHGSELWPK